MTATSEEIFEKVQTALIDALGVDDDEVVPGATLVGDLGAESIDFLDIVFRLEKAFGISIPREDLSPEDILTNSQFVNNGLVTCLRNWCSGQYLSISPLHCTFQQPQPYSRLTVSKAI